MQFRTVIEPLKNSGSISHTDQVMLLGSCFSDNIGSRMRDALFCVSINPFGTIYNPASIAAVIDRIISGKPFGMSDLVQHGRMYHSFLCHSSLSSVNPEEMLTQLNNRLTEARSFLKECTWVTITLGTAWVYRLQSTNAVVSNCHKLPASMFSRKRLDIDETARILTSTISQLKKFNDRIKIILTVSPIRHWADGAHGNQLSKSTLLLAAGMVQASMPDDVVYFPAYEIMMDDLRDYRFYSADLCHPTDMAVDYIFDIFSKSFFSADTIDLAAKCRKYTRRLNHRQLTDDYDAARAFAESTRDMGLSLCRQYPFLTKVIHNI